MRCTARLMIFGWSLLSTTFFACAQGVDVSAKIIFHDGKVSGDVGRRKATNASEVVVWLSPLQALDTSVANPVHSPYQLLQKDKQFTPHLLVVPTGSDVEFPNADPFFHNVFSLFNGKRFDLGLYESKTSRSVRFDREGVSYIFCNIHPEMGAVVLALSTPFYAVSQVNGAVVIHGVPPGSYRLEVWSEHAKPLNQKEFQRVVKVPNEAFNVGDIALETITSPLSDHKNKFGEDYKPEPGSPY